MRMLEKLPTLRALAGDRTLRIAVTGLSRSGKTAFITSLVQNLLSAVGRPARLPFLRAAAERRLLGARLLAPEADDLPPFPLDNTVAALAADPPHWPASTTDLRRVRLSLRFSTAGFLRVGLLRGTASSGCGASPAWAMRPELSASNTGKRPPRVRPWMSAVMNTVLPARDSPVTPSRTVGLKKLSP